MGSGQRDNKMGNDRKENDEHISVRRWVTLIKKTRVREDDWRKKVFNGKSITWGNKAGYTAIRCVLARTSLMLTDGPTDGPTDGRTDRPSYRDARTHLKIIPILSKPLFNNRYCFIPYTTFYALYPRGQGYLVITCRSPVAFIPFEFRITHYIEFRSSRGLKLTFSISSV